MYRTPTHDSRNKQGTRERELKSRARKYEESKESMYGSITEEDDESTDRDTEDSEDTTESFYEEGRRGESSAGGSQMEREKAFATSGQTEDFLMRAYYANEKFKKHDKKTQKNFLSPFPSFLIPPIYRDVARPLNIRYASPRVVRDDQNYADSYDRSTRISPKDTYEKKVRSPSRDCRDKKLCEMHKNKNEMKNFSSKNGRSERVLTCLQGESSLEPSSIFTRSPASPRNETLVIGQKQKSASQENRISQMLNYRKNCSESNENQKKGKPCQVRSSQITDNVREHNRNGKNLDERLESVTSGKVKEKLMYVVEEEEGKKVTKLETDLFSLHEILAIKKDLLELSEFAKKLKKLKEMRKDVEKEKSDKSCQCKPVGELLKNVNKKIEALEARQEELEMGSLKSDQKFSTEIESNKAVDPKNCSNLPSKPLSEDKQSGVPTSLSFPKTEILLSKVGFSNNFEIANELMDIKNQLQKLEKRHMSETAPESGFVAVPKQKNKKEHGIAVFSSKTYILTSENYREKLKGDKIKEVSNCVSAVEKPKRKTEQIQENVANWLRNVSPVEEKNENEVPVFLNMEEVNGAGTFGGSTLKETHLTKCETSAGVFKDDSLKIKEPQKNRASQMEPKNKPEINLEALTGQNKINKSTNEKDTDHLKCKQCIVTTSGKLFFLNSHDNLPLEKIIDEKIAPKIIPQKKGLPKEICGVTSNGSEPSEGQAKNKNLRNKLGTTKEAVQDICHSENARECSTVSSYHKDQKTVRNVSVKNLMAPPTKEKTRKENKNEVKKQKKSTKCDDLKSSSTYSQLLGTVDLDTAKVHEPFDRKEDENRNMHVYSLGGMPKFNFKCLESKGSESYILIQKKPKKRVPETVREVSNTLPNRERDCDVQEPSTSRQISKEPKSQKGRHCDCDSCCMKRLKKETSQDRVSIVQTVSSMSNASRGSRQCRRSQRRRERCEENRLRREAKALLKLERRREKMKKADCKNAEKKLRQRLRSEGKKCKEDASRKGNRERSKIKRLEDCLRLRRKSRERSRRRRSRESCRPRKRKKSCSISSCESQLLCKCEDKPRSVCGHPECRLEKMCIRVIQAPPPPKEPPKPALCSETQSEDTVELYARRECPKPPVVKNKLESDSCKFGSFFKSLRRLYPKFSHLQFGNFSGEINDRKLLQQQEKQMESLKNNAYNLNDCESVDSEKHSHRHSSTSFRHRTDHYHYPHHHSSHRHGEGSQHLKNCKCIRVFVQSQQQQEWPGVMPFPSLSAKDPEEISCSESTERSKTLKSDFIFPGKLPDYQCIGYSAEKRCEQPCIVKCKMCKPKRRKRREKCRKPRKRRKSRCCKVVRCCEEDLCKCRKCGNVHEKDSEKSFDEQPAINFKPAQSVQSPMFSFLRYFCKSKPQQSKKSGYNIFSKISEVRHLRTCAKVRSKKAGKKYSCVCVKKFVPENISKREEKPQCRNVEACCCCKKRRKRRRKRKCCICTVCESVDNSDRKRRKRRRRKRECLESNPASRTEFCVCPLLFHNNNVMTNNNMKELSELNCTNSTNDTNKSGTNETSGSGTTKTMTTTTTTSPTTAEEEKSLSILKLENDLRKKDWKLKEKLSSIQFLLKNLEKFKKSKCQTRSSDLIGSPQPDLIDECRKCNLKIESSSFMKIIKKLRENKSEKKNKTGKKIK